MLKKLKDMNIKKKLNYGYVIVIVMMLISGVCSIACLGILYGNMNSYVNGAQRADTAVKTCRININIAARNIREMALNPDSSTYQSYEETVIAKLDEVDSELQALKATGLISDELYQRYADALSEWGNTGYVIMEEIKAGEIEAAQNSIFTVCVPALNNLIELSKELDAETDVLKEEALSQSMFALILGIVFIVVFIVVAAIMAVRIGKIIVNSITEPLSEIEKVAAELTLGNLHSTLEYHANDEIGSLAHSLRKSIRILGSYVDDISNAMEEFSHGNFVVQPEVEWKGDFVNILTSFKF